MTKPPTRRNPADGLGFRVAFLLAIVLLPLTVISVVKSMTVIEESRGRSEAALMGETLRAASGELRYIQETRGAAKVLSKSIWPLVSDNGACSGFLRRILELESHFSLVAFVPVSGVSTCNSAGRVFSFKDDPLYLRAAQDRGTSFAVKAVGLVSGTSVLVITHPVFDDAGSYRGFVSLSIPHSGIRAADDGGADGKRPLTMITFDKRGVVLTSTLPLDDVALAIPGDRSLATLAVENAISFSAPSAAGVDRTFSVVPLVRQELFALGSWPDAVSGGQNASVIASAPVLVPFLMWIASVVVAWLAVQRQVIRHIQKLGRSMISFAGGSRHVGDIDVSGAPSEIREMAEAYEQMTDTILHDEAHLEDMVHQKEVLLREVHHRVKNNLQLIASIMNMQMRRTSSEEARAIMRGLQDRVMSLATIHRELYQTAGLSDIHADELLSTIVGQIVKLSDRPDRRISVHADFDQIRMVPDQAVPLALLLSEAVTNALKYAVDSEHRVADLWVSLKAKDGSRALLAIRNTTRQPRPVTVATNEPAGLGTQLIAAFAMQIGGTVERRESDGTYELAIDFGLRPLSYSEDRRQPPCEAAATPEREP